MNSPNVMGYVSKLTVVWAKRAKNISYWSGNFGCILEVHTMITEIRIEKNGISTSRASEHLVTIYPISAVYGIVCVSSSTQVTRTIEHQLSPTFDQTLKFEDIEVIGSGDYLHLTRPRVTIRLFHKGPQVVEMPNTSRLSAKLHYLILVERWTDNYKFTNC